MRVSIGVFGGALTLLAACSSGSAPQTNQTRRLIVTGSVADVADFTTDAAFRGAVDAVTVRPGSRGSIATLHLPATTERGQVLKLTRAALRARLSYRYVERFKRVTTT